VLDLLYIREEIGNNFLRNFTDFMSDYVALHSSGRHFDTIEVLEADSHAVLNSLTEHGFQIAFKNWQKRWERCIRPGVNYFEDHVDQ
jgi:hypothetical protein